LKHALVEEEVGRVLVIVELKVVLVVVQVQVVSPRSAKRLAELMPPTSAGVASPELYRRRTAVRLTIRWTLMISSHWYLTVKPVTS
jgi:hypothetical protein